MFFNYDFFEIVAVAFVVSGIFTFTLYKSSPIINKESLVNTSLNSDLSNNLTTSQLIDAAVQTDVNIPVEAGVQAAITYVNTGMQTSSRMWLESIRNWITEILGTPTNPNPQYVDVGVQTNAPSLWLSVKQRFLEVCSVKSSDLSSMGYNKVEKWRTGLDSIQSVDLHDSESPLTKLEFGSPSSLQQLVKPDDRASQVSEVTSESSLHVPSNSVYDINIYNQDFLYESLKNVSNHIDYNHVIDGINHTVLVIGNHILTIDPNISYKSIYLLVLINDLIYKAIAYIPIPLIR